MKIRGSTKHERSFLFWARGSFSCCACTILYYECTLLCIDNIKGEVYNKIHINCFSKKGDVDAS